MYNTETNKENEKNIIADIVIVGGYKCFSTDR
jgi:hypothetical protein